MVGLLTDVLGRSRLVLASVTAFSVAMVLCGVAPGVALFALGRVLVGVGVGGVLPSIAALVLEFSPPQRRNLNTSLAFAGVGVGGALAAVVAATVVPVLGFVPSTSSAAWPPSSCRLWPSGSSRSPSSTCGGVASTRRRIAAMIIELKDAISGLVADPEIRSVVLTGAGRGFSAGAICG